MPNSFVNSSLISKDAAIYFKNMDTFMATGNRAYQGMWSNGMYDAGDTISIRLDNQFEVKQGDTVTVGDISESTLPLTLQPIYSVPVEYTTVDLTTDLYQGWSERVLRPAIRNLVSKINADIAAQARTQVYYTSGAVNADINSFAAVEAPGTILTELGAPMDERWYYALTPKDGSAVKNSLQNSFNDRLNRDISDRSALGYLSYFDMYFDQSIAKQSITATKGAGPFTVNAPVADGASVIQVAGLTPTTGTIAAGETFQVAGVEAVNRITKQASGRTMTFVATALATADGAGVANVSVAPVVYGPATPTLQNVSANPAAADVVTFESGVSQYNVNLAYTANALHVVMPPLAPLDTPESDVFTDGESGISLRVSKSGEILDNKNILRIDALVGYRWIGEQAVRVHSQV